MINKERLKANSFHIPLKARSIQAVITSPPYRLLRKYDIPDITIDGWTGQFGLEPTVKLYIEHLMLFMEQCWKVLKNDGICWINIGDTYSGSWQNYNGKARGKNKKGIEFKPPCRSGKLKSLCLVPERFVIACQDAGWIIRNVIIWHKPNCIPESVQDRFARKFEYVYMLTKEKSYYFDLDAVREKINIPDPPRKLSNKSKSKWTNVPGQHTHGFMRNGGHQGYYDKEGNLLVNPKGKNPGDIWKISAQPTRHKHYASFPEKLVERMLLCSTRAGDIVLDPFGGSGTTGRVAIKLGRKPVLLDLGYHHLQKERTNNVQIGMEALGKLKESG